MTTLSWNQPICERCWIMKNSTADGDNLSVRAPHTHVTGLETCAFCGEPTIVGIYVRHDPKRVAYPAVDDD